MSGVEFETEVASPSGGEEGGEGVQAVKEVDEEQEGDGDGDGAEGIVKTVDYLPVTAYVVATVVGGLAVAILGEVTLILIRERF